MYIQEVTIYYLHMTDPGQLRPKRQPPANFELKQAEIPLPELNRFLYTATGVGWYWIDRLGWNYRRWQQWLEQPGVSTWIAYLSGTPAGYFELAAADNGDVEIAYFGILPRFTGQGLGGYMLSCAVEYAWQLDAGRVHLNTCTLDHPGALANYRARGFKLYKQETELRELPDEPPGPWPHAHA